jgi:hypothetical protein
MAFCLVQRKIIIGDSSLSKSYFNISNKISEEIHTAFLNLQQMTK